MDGSQNRQESLDSVSISSEFDVGIVGYWYATNYGSVITYYSLFHFIESLGYKAVLIDRPDKHLDGEPLTVFSRVFMEKHARISESFGECEPEKYDNLADIFIVGSDQVFTEHAIELTGYRFFLDFASENKGKLTYAPSFGRDKFDLPFNKKLIVSYLLSRFDKISVREEGGADILDRLGVHADVVPDPVFLNGEDFYSSLADLSGYNTEHEYVLSYILDPNTEKRRILKEAEGKTNLPLINLLDGRYGTAERNRELLGLENTLSDITPEDFLKLIKDCRLLITDSHHGLALAIIFHKPVICINNRERGSERFTSLLSRLRLDGILIEESDSLSEREDLLTPPSRDRIDSSITLLSDIGRSWLSEALRTAKNNKTKEKY